jgi:hypothetical protein
MPRTACHAKSMSPRGGTPWQNARMPPARLLAVLVAVVSLAASFVSPDALAAFGARALGRGALENVTVEALGELPWLLRGLALAAVAWLLLRPLEGAPRASATARPGTPALAGIVVAGMLLAAAVRVLVLGGGMISGDEWNNEFTARLFAQGRLWDRPPPHPEFFRFTYFVTLPDRTFSIFPPLWPAVLALGHLGGIGGWINVLVAGAATWLVGRWHDDRAAGLSSAALLVLSPMFVFSAASYFASPTVLLLLLAELACLRRALQPGARAAAWMAVAGLLWGLGFAAHYPSAIGAGLPPLAWASWRVRRAALAAFAAALVPLAALGAYHSALHGGPPWLLPAALGDTSMLRPDLGPALLFKGAAYTALHAVRLLGWTFPLLPLLALPGLVAALAPGARAAEARLLGLAVAGLVLVYFVYPSAGGPQYGPRYWFALLGPLAILAGPIVTRLAATRRGVAFLALLVAGSFALFGVRAVHERGRAARENAPFRLAAEARLEQAVVVMQNVNQADHARNAPGWSGPVLFVPDLGPEANAELFPLFPDRTFHTYRRGPDGPVLEPGVEGGQP